MNDTDRKWAYAGAACFAGGAIAAAATRRPFWFAAGAVLGAGVVGMRLWEKEGNKQQLGTVRTPVAALHAKVLAAHPECSDALGAPELQPVDPGVLRETPMTNADVAGSAYPVPFRVPDVEVRTDPMDPRIAPHFHGLLGPGIESDVRHWP